MEHKITVKDELNEADISDIHARLRAYNRSLLENTDVRDIGVFLEDESGNTLGGLTGDTHGDWLEVDFFFVEPSERKKGIGSRMLRAAEDAARERGCKHVFLNTFGFQAPGFYKKLGYSEVFTLTDYPVTGTRHYFTKEL